MPKSYVTGRGDYNAICDVCGFKYKASELRKRWDGWMVCKDDFELRHPSDFYRPQNNPIQLPFTRPETDINYRVFPADYSPTNTPQTSTGVQSFGVRFTALTNGYFNAVNFRSTLEGAYKQPTQMILVLRNMSSATTLWSTQVTPMPSIEGWVSYPITPNAACVSGNSYLVFACLEDQASMGGVQPEPILSAERYLSYFASFYDSFGTLSESNIPTNIHTNLYLIDVSVRPS